MRIDVPLLRAMESSVAADFDLAIGTIFAGKQPLVVRGFALTNITAGSPANQIQCAVASSILANFNATESGSMYFVPANRANEVMASTNAKVSGTFTSSATNFIGVDLRRLADDTTSDILQFLSGTTLLETSKTVPLARTLDYRFVISTSDFSSQPNLVPIAKVVTDASNNIVSVVDARHLSFRLGDGGDFPDSFGFYSWPGTRYENTTGDVFSGGDKAILSQKDWQDAIMTRLWEIGGGEHWYSATADRNVNMVWTGSTFTNGENFEWDGSNLHWKGIRFIFDNSTGTYNDINDQLTDSVGLTNLSDGECIYVDLDRTQNFTSPTGLQPAKSALSTLGPGSRPGARQVMAWRVGAFVYTRGWRYPVGTTFVPATTTSLGVVKLNQTPGAPLAPVVVSIMANGQISITATGGGSPAAILTGNGIGDGATMVGGATNGTGGFGLGGGATGSGLQGTSAGGAGVAGNSTSGPAVRGQSTSGPAFLSTGGDAQIPAANKYTFTTARARSIHIPAQDFQLSQAWGDGRIAAARELGSDGGAYRNGAWHCSPRGPGDNTRLQVKAPLRLPHGATLTNMTALYAIDFGSTATLSDAGEAKLTMLRRVFSAGTVTTTKLNSGTGIFGGSGVGDMTVAETNVATSAHTIDNTDATYELDLDLASKYTRINTPVQPYAGANSGGTSCALMQDGRILITGGYAAGAAIASARIYDPNSGLLVNATNMNRVRAGHRMYTFASGRVLVFGGHTGNGTTRVQTCEVYDSDTNTWTDLAGSLTNAISFSWLASPRGDIVYVLSGTTGGEEKRFLQVSDFGGVATLASSAANRVGGALAYYAPDGTADTLRIGVFGGGANLASTTNTWESYNPYTDTWTNGSGTLAAARNSALAATLPDGSVFLTGGAASASAEQAVKSGGVDASLNFTALTAPAQNLTDGRAFISSDGGIVCVGSTATSIYKFRNIGSGGTWDRFNGTGSSTITFHERGAADGDVVMLTNDDLVATNARDISHAVTDQYYVRSSMRIPNIRFYGVRINYSYTEVNSET